MPYWWARAVVWGVCWCSLLHHSTASVPHRDVDCMQGIRRYCTISRGRRHAEWSSDIWLALAWKFLSHHLCYQQDMGYWNSDSLDRCCMLEPLPNRLQPECLEVRGEPFLGLVLEALWFSRGWECPWQLNPDQTFGTQRDHRTSAFRTPRMGR